MAQNRASLGTSYYRLMSPVKTLELYKTPMRHLQPGKERVRGIFTKLTVAHRDRQELMGQEPIFCPESNRDKIGPECSWLASGRWHTLHRCYRYLMEEGTTLVVHYRQRSVEARGCQISGLFAEEKTRQGKVSVLHSESMSCGWNTY